MSSCEFFPFLQLFAAEIINWDREQERKKKGATEECQDGVLIGDDPECQIIELKPDLSSSHSLLAQDFTRRACANVAPRFSFDKGKSRSEVINVVEELRQMAEAKIGKEDHQGEEPRLLSYIHYLTALRVGEEVLRYGLLEQVAYSGLHTTSDSARLLCQGARELLAAEEALAVESKKWHRAYHNFRCVFF